MPQTYNVGSRSRFVNFVAWMFILLAAFACEWAVIQNATQSSWSALAGDQAHLPWLTGLLLRHVAWVYSAAIALSLAMIVCAAGLLRRIEWARQVFIGLLVIAIGVDLAGLWLQQEFMHLLVDSALRQATLTQPAADLDVSAAWTEDRKAITVSVVNATATARSVVLDLGKTAVKNSGTLWEITGANPEVHNEPGAAPQLIRSEQKPLNFIGKLDSPAYSARLYRLEVQ